MLFTDAEKTDIRRHCGYPAYGAGAAGFQAWRFYQAYGLLEYRINVVRVLAQSNPAPQGVNQPSAKG